MFGLTSALAAPQLTLFDSANTPMATNSGWGAAPVAGASTVQAGLIAATPDVMTKVGAFPLASNSKDCAMVVTLLPGAYTAQVTGVNGSTGIALVEIYEVP
jgi:hypothetical protein